MQSGDAFAFQPLFPPLHFRVASRWETAVGGWTADRVRSVENLLGALLSEGLRAAVMASAEAPERPALRVLVHTAPLHWELPPLEVTLALTVELHSAAWRLQASLPATADGESRTWIARIVAAAGQAATRAGQAVALALPDLSFIEATSERIDATVAEAAVRQLHLDDLEAIRHERVPVEFVLLFESLAVASNQMLTLADLLAVAASKALDDEAVLGCVNFYVAKGMLVFDRRHQVVKMTEHGRAVCRNVNG